MSQDHAVGNTVTQRHHQHTHECGKGFGKIVKIDFGDIAHHHQADDDQHGSGGGTGHRKEEGGEKQGQQEAEGGDNGGESAATAGIDTRGAFYKGGDGAGTHGGTGHDGEGAHQEDPAQGRGCHLSLTGNLRDQTNQGADGAEQIDKEQGDHHKEHVGSENAFPFKLPEYGGHARRRADDSFQMGHSHGDADQGGQQDTQQQGAGHLADVQCGGQNESGQCQQRGGCLQVAQGHQGGGTVGHDSGVLESDEGDIQADARGDGYLQGRGDGIDNFIPQIEHREEEEEDAFEKDSGQGELPGIAHYQADRIGEEGIHPHAGRHREGQFGDDRHQQGGKGRGDRRGGEQGPFVHSYFREHAGMHGENICHGQEGGDSGGHLRLHRHGLRIVSKQLLYHRSLKK